MKVFSKQARQGDVFLRRIDKLPENLQEIPRERGKVVLAHGEVTGHAHAISEAHVMHYRVDPAMEVKAEANGMRTKLRAAGNLAPSSYLVVENQPASLLHEEHEGIQIPPGTYEIRRQREYDENELRNVAD